MSASQAILDSESPLCFNRGVGEKQSRQSSTGMGVSPEGRNAGFSPAMTTNDDNGDDMNKTEARVRPQVGQPIRVGEMVIIPSYVRLSEPPLSNGACVTGTLVGQDGFDPHGWYVEYTHAGDEHNQHRDFFPFDEVRPL